MTQTPPLSVMLHCRQLQQMILCCIPNGVSLHIALCACCMQGYHEILNSVCVYNFTYCTVSLTLYSCLATSRPPKSHKIKQNERNSQKKSGRLPEHTQKEEVGHQAHVVQGPEGTFGGAVDQLVERWTGTPLRQVQFPGAARVFSSRVNFQCRLSQGVCAALMCSHMH